MNALLRRFRIGTRLQAGFAAVLLLVLLMIATALGIRRHPGQHR